MLILTIASFILHAVVIYKGFGFFRLDKRCRDTDKSVVATLMAASIVFILMQLFTWISTPWGLVSFSIVESLRYGFDLFNAVFYWTLIHFYTERRVCRTNDKQQG